MGSCTAYQLALLLFISADFAFAWEVVEHIVKVGDNVTLPCFPEGEGKNVMWWKQDKSKYLTKWSIKGDGSLWLHQVTPEDDGLYTCALDEEIDNDPSAQTIAGHHLSEKEADVLSRHKLTVLGVPGPLVNVSVHPSTVLALLMWDVGYTGGCELSHFTARYRAQDSEDWQEVLPHHISPTTRQIDVYHLSPNTTYVFQAWATNEIGSGERVSVEATTKHTVEEIELARHLLQGVEEFDTRVWVVAVSIVMGTLVVLTLGTCWLMLRDHHVSMWPADDKETLELVPNIILNPGFHDDPDENSNDQPHVAFNNNSILRPMRV